MAIVERWAQIWRLLLETEVRNQVFVATAFLVFTGLELAWPAQRGQSWIGRARNVLYLAIYFTLGFAALAWWFLVHPPPESGQDLGFARTALLVVAYLVVADFIYYWYHRAQHRFPFLWAIHELHHADAELNVTTSYRIYWLEVPVQFLIVFAPAVLILGPKGPVAGLVVLVAGRLFLLFTHSNLRLSLGSLSPVLCGPQVHRIHHSRLAEHQDRNFSQYFPLLDVIFGTYYAPRRNEYPPTGTAGLASDESVPSVMLKPLVIWRDGLRKVTARESPSRERAQLKEKRRKRTGPHKSSRS